MCADTFMSASFVHALLGSGARVSARLWSIGNWIRFLVCFKLGSKLVTSLLGDDFRKLSSYSRQSTEPFLKRFTPFLREGRPRILRSFLGGVASSVQALHFPER